MQICTAWTKEYASVGEELKASVKPLGYQFDSISLESTGNWERNCSLKAGAILEFMERYPAFWWIDADMHLKRPLEEPDVEIGLLHQVPDDLRTHHNSQRYAYHLRRYGMRILTGAMWFRRSDETVEMVKRWKALCDLAPDEWDEHQLMTAWIRSGRPNASLFRYHLNGTLGTTRVPHSHLRERKVLMLGSGRDLKKWVKKHLDGYIDHGYAVVALNNAWKAVPLDWLHGWIAPADFSGEAPPAEVPRLNGHGAAWNMRPYRDMGVATTFTHGAYHLINDAIRDKVRLILHVAGCDMDYDGDKTHFYGKGSPDPLRYRLDVLASSLSRIGVVCRSRGFQIANAGEHSPTRLPYDRVTSPKETTMNEKFQVTTITESEAAKPNWTSDRDIYLTPHGSVVEADHPERRRLLVGRGAQLPMSKAIGLGIVKVAEPPAADEPPAEEKPKRAAKKKAPRPKRTR